LNYEVFICYRQDTGDDFAFRLWSGLSVRGISTFLDSENIPKRFKGTETWWEFRNQAIRDCNVFLMIVTDGFEKSDEIRKEIALANAEKKDFMCMMEKGLPPNVQTALLLQNVELRDLQQTPFSTPAELLRSVLKHYNEPKPEPMEKIPSPITQPTAKEKAPFPLIHFKITQAIGNNPLVKRKLPKVGFNISNSGDSPIRAKVKARVFLGSKDLGLVKGSKRGGKYMGYYDGKRPWSLNPYTIVFGNFSVPKICAETDEDLRIEVNVTLIDTDGQNYKLLPVSWTFMRDKNSWFLEPTGD
jgi:hypothetical protein